jgi:Putative zinc-finger
MMDADLPPLPLGDISGPSVCATVQLYLAVLDDLSPEQAQLVFAHVKSCAECRAELRLLSRAAPLATGLDEFAPPPRVDQVVLAAITLTGQAPHHTFTRRFMRERRSPWLMLFAAAALLVVLVLTTPQLLSALFSPPRAFALPANLSWSGYVLSHTETLVGTHGVKYHINCYHDLGTGGMHVETTAGRNLDIVAVGNGQDLLGEDLIHHIAQWGADAWGVDDSLFNLGQLRADLQAHRAIYLGQGTYQGQEVYRIRWRHGLVLLLDRQYLPVNVLRNASGPGTGQPLYETLVMLPATQVPAALWETRIPAGFQIGMLPVRS